MTAAEDRPCVSTKPEVALLIGARRSRRRLAGDDGDARPVAKSPMRPSRPPCAFFSACATAKACGSRSTQPRPEQGSGYFVLAWASSAPSSSIIPATSISSSSSIARSRACAAGVDRRLLRAPDAAISCCCSRSARRTATCSAPISGCGPTPARRRSRCRLPAAYGYYERSARTGNAPR